MLCTREGEVDRCQWWAAWWECQNSSGSTRWECRDDHRSRDGESDRRGGQQLYLNGTECATDSSASGGCCCVCYCWRLYTASINTFIYRIKAAICISVVITGREELGYHWRWGREIFSVGRLPRGFYGVVLSSNFYHDFSLSPYLVRQSVAANLLLHPSLEKSTCKRSPHWSELYSTETLRCLSHWGVVNNR